MQNKSKLYFLKPVSGNITIGLSLKYKNEKEPSNIDVKLQNIKAHDKKLKNSKDMQEINLESNSTNSDISSF